jgi:ribosomal protein L11 methyltransferase
MHTLAVECAEGDRDWLIAEFYERGTLGVIETDMPGGRVVLEAFFEARFDPEPFARWTPAWRVRTPDAESWQAAWEPLCVGERFFLVPAWRGDPAPSNRLRLEIHAGMASGSGYHAPTQLMLEAMEEFLRPGDRFLDVGTGSGILSAAANLLEAGVVFACDPDRDAIAEAAAHGVENLFRGSARSVRSGSMDVVAANLNAAALAQLGDDLVRVLRPGGRLILSGFRSHQVNRIRAAFPLEDAWMRERDGWFCVTAIMTA